MQATLKKSYITQNAQIFNNSEKEYAKAKYYIPGGVNSPVRSFKGINSEPFFVKKGSGARITDVDGNEYLDFCMSWGVHILGHAPSYVLDKVEEALWDGTSYGMPTPLETLLAESISGAMPSVEQVRLVNSGTEAVMSAIRLARAFTHKNKIIKFEGCYHGHADHLLVSGGSGLASLGIPSSAGVPSDFIRHTISIPFNDQNAVAETFEKYRDDIAAIIIEPVPANMGVILPEKGFLSFLREITIKYGSLLIFDEVITGFRPKISGAQGYYQVNPDLTTLGKIIGGGFPVGAYGGRKDIMSLVAPEGNVYQAGTLAGNPIAVTAGLATLKRLRSPLFYETLNHKSRDFVHYLEEITKNKGIVIHSFQSMFTIFFSEHEIQNYEDVKKTDLPRFEKFFKKMLSEGIFLSPSQFETNFISSMHTPADLSRVLEVIHRILKKV